MENLLYSFFLLTYICYERLSFLSFKKIKETDKRTMKKIFIFSFKLFFQNEQFERKFSLSFLKEKTPDH